MLKIKNLDARYKNTNKLALSDISFSVEKGEIIAILGPSGSGKTTLLNLIIGILTEKELEISGQIEKDPDLSRADISLVWQQPTLLPWRKVASNIAYGLEARKINPDEINNMTRAMIDLTGLSGSENLLPYQLSIGMQQRVNFARALACRPKLMLLDEPFSALDQETKQTIKEHFLKIIKTNQVTSLFVTHNIEEAFSIADKIVVFSKSPATIQRIFDNSQPALNFDKVSAGLDYFYE